MRHVWWSSLPAATRASTLVAAPPREREPGALASRRGSGGEQALRRLPQPRQSGTVGRSRPRIRRSTIPRRALWRGPGARAISPEDLLFQQRGTFARRGRAVRRQARLSAASRAERAGARRLWGRSQPKPNHRCAEAGRVIGVTGMAASCERVTVVGGARRRRAVPRSRTRDPRGRRARPAPDDRWWPTRG
jgi:hypothetical protein